jgi:hypothetical protein
MTVVAGMNPPATGTWTESAISLSVSIGIDSLFIS